MQVKAILAVATALLMGLGTPLRAQLDPAARLLSHQAQQAPVRGQGDEERVSLYIRCDADETDWEAIYALGGKVGVYAQGLATLSLPIRHLSALAEVKGVSYVQASQKAHPMLDLAREDIHANEAQQLFTDGVEPLPYTGHGGVIGQVDAGLDYIHNAFKTAEGAFRIKRVWEQGTNPATAPIPGLHSPEPFGYGSEFDTPELIEQAGGDSDAGSHGTHVMGIAAGSDPWMEGKYHGIAPDAELVMVAITDTDDDNVHVSDAIKYIFDYADSVQKPCVINLSLGSHKGPHDGTSPFDQLADALQGPGRLIVGASGNYGGDLFHVSRNIQAQPDTLLLQLYHHFYSNFVYGDVEFWADPQLTLRFELIDHGSLSGTLDVVSSFTMEELMDGQVHTYTLGRNITGSVQVTAELNPLNGKRHMLLRSYLTGQRQNHQVAMRIVSTEGNGQLDVWADDAKITLATRDKNGVVNLPTGYSNPDGESTISEIGGTAHRILSVGAYTTRDKFQKEGDQEILEVNYPVQQNPVIWAAPLVKDELCIFSGFGPTADGRQKPEVCAPGSFIISSMSGYDVTGQYLATHYTDAKGHPQRYGYLQGTSFSTPMVTGAVALWLQANPQLTPEELKEVVAHSSRVDDFSTDTRYWGSGKLDVEAGLRYCIEHRDNSIEQLETQPYSHRVYNLSGQCIDAEKAHGFVIVNEDGKTRKVWIR